VQIDDTHVAFLVIDVCATGSCCAYSQWQSILCAYLPKNPHPWRFFPGERRALRLHAEAGISRASWRVDVEKKSWFFPRGPPSGGARKRAERDRGLLFHRAPLIGAFTDSQFEEASRALRKAT